LLNGREKEVFQHILGRQPDENEDTERIERADESPEDFRYIIIIQQRFLNKIYTSIGSLFIMVAEKSKDGDGPGFSDEEEEVRPTINNALAIITPEESVNLRAKKNTIKRPSSAISVSSSGRTTPATDSALHSILNDISISKRNSKTLRETKKTMQFKLCSTSETAGQRPHDGDTLAITLCCHGGA